jgi:hypothetical protein
MNKKAAKVVQRANAQRLPKDYGIKRSATLHYLFRFLLAFAVAALINGFLFFPFFF